MFRTDLSHFLQSFDSPFLYEFMQAVSFMGTIYMLLLTILVLIGGVNFRKGFLVLNIVGWGVLIMLGAKSYFDFPRPLAVDTTLENFGREQTTQNYTDLQPTGFFEVFSEELLSKTRSSDIARHGLPSGHVMIITTAWLGMALLFRKKALCVISISLILLTIISRMYLGMHYLGDVSLGLLLGIGLVYLFMKLFSYTGLSERMSFGKAHIFFLGAPIMLLLLHRVVPGFQAGALVGLNLGLILILKLWGEPMLTGSVGKRVINTLLFVLLYFTMFFLSKKLLLGKVGLISMLVNSTLNFAFLIGVFYLGKLFGFYTFKENEIK